MYTKLFIKQNEQGSVLVLVLLILMVMSVLIIGALDLLTTDLKIIGNHLHDIQATYIADAGIEDAICELRQDVYWSVGFVNKEFPSGSGNIYTVTVDNSSYPLVTITSTSNVSGFQRTIEAQLEIDDSLTPPYVKVIYWKEL
ncbi:MAG: PilX N-terminal domain-containing pilus assembly protein [Candidatus Poribacteria bacterium]